MYTLVLFLQGRIKMRRPHKAYEKFTKFFDCFHIFYFIVVEIRKDEFLFFYALCYEQTSPLVVYQYSFG